jgi:hypothetical protein
VTRSIREIITDSVAGPTGAAANWDDVSNWLAKTAFAESERNERALAQRRQEFFQGKGDRFVVEVVSKVFHDPEVRDRRDVWVPIAKDNNVWKRIVQEKATVYNVPAIRRLGNDADQAKFDELARRCRLNSMAKRWNQWGALQNTLAVGFRVRTRYQGEKKPERKTPIVDVVSRSSFFAVAHPFDATECIAIGIRISTARPEDTGPEQPELWEVWTDHERFYCDGTGAIAKETVWDHEWERMPWLLYSPEPPAGALIDHDTGSETDAAHVAVWFEKVCELKESASATKMLSADTGIAVELKDGTSAFGIDMSVPLEMFRNSANGTFETTAANHGIAPNVLKHQGVQSAQARELMRAPLKELRREQEDYLRGFEREFVEIVAMVVARDLTELSFSTDEWSTDFQERATALDPKTEDEVFEGRRRLGLTSTVKEIMKRNPDLSREQAENVLQENIEDEYARNSLMRPLQRISGSMGAEQSDAATPEVPPTETGEQGDAGLRAIDGGVNDDLEKPEAAAPPLARRSGRRRRR